MIRRLSLSDHEACFRLLKTRPAENLFIIGDIEAFGYDQSFQKLWGEFNSQGELIAVLLKYEQNYIPFASGPFHAEKFAEIMCSDPEFSMMSGLKEMTAMIEPFLTRKQQRKRETYYAKCTRIGFGITAAADTSNVKQAVPDDADAILRFLKTIPEFNDGMGTVESKRRNLGRGTSRTFYIEDEGEIVSTASTAAENSLSAMIVAVATSASHKRKGLASQCLVKLVRELLDEGKQLCLFYDNPEAGSIYKRIGFEDIGFWMMYTYEKEEGK
ncbi:hypothetical protein SAMN05421736_101160 [Evansella caseinilytica]|uniref:N-acetyltransferase domain-containing protein n=1 Tax=Evansella caseinilytica TaxID=1503961 RepID=A0A1H3GIA7_9BACI|nr:GNAT family N-acetyltransferase [Evansella caseinilytica]SDY02224.1 hypothetical protein SAMN05421736_101160 [Evansella caseinilytica]